MFSNARSRLHNRWHDLLSFAFPQSCSLCNDELLTTANLRSPESPWSCFCPACTAELRPKAGQSCERCGATVGAYAATGQGCVHCRKRKLHFASAICLGMYEDLLRVAILSGKWSYSAVEMESLADLLAVERRVELQQIRADLIVPIPQGWRQRLKRRLNPAERIATRLAKAMKIPIDRHLLARSRTTLPQKRVAVNRRFENQENAFRVQDSHLIKGRRILLVDDVLTSGATCSEAARLMKANGASECYVAVIGRVLDHST